MEGWRAFVRCYCGKQAVMALFLLCALPISVITAVITPPSQSPDEVSHYARALGLLRGAVLGVKHPDIDPNNGKLQWHTGVKVNAGELRASYGFVTLIDGWRPVVTQKDWDSSEAVQTQDFPFYINLPNTATYFPAAYVPSALGVGVARLFHATPLHRFIVARLCMAAAFLASGLAALYVAAFGEALLVTVLVLPMTVFLAGTMNQDGLLIAMTCLAAACLTRGTRGWRIAGLVIFALVLGAKPPYILLLGVFALPLFTPGFWRRFCDMLVAMAPVLLWIVVISLFVVVPYGKQQYYPGSLYTGDHTVLMDHANASAQWHILAERPRRFLALPYYSTIRDHFADFITVIGVLGPLQLVMPHWFYFTWGGCLAFAAFGLLLTGRAARTPPWTALVNFIAITGAILVTYWILMITFYLDWTNVGAPDVDGIQGRYFLIFIPFLLFAIPHVSGLPWLGRVRINLPPLLLALPSLVMAVFDIGYIPLKMVLNYYLH